MPADRIIFRLGNLTRADGSAIAAMAASSVQVAVHGPGDVPMHKELAGESVVEVVFKSAARSKEMTSEDKELQEFVRGIVQSVVRVELYPKTLIQIIVQELETDGSFLSLALNCISAALMDSGISLKTTFAAATCAVNKSGQIVENPKDDELLGTCGFLTTILDSNSKEIISIRQSGRHMSLSQICQSLERNRKECHLVFESLYAAAKSANAVNQ